MSGILRRLRGALGNAVVWASSWFAAGLGLGTAFYLGLSLPTPFWPYVVGGALDLATAGFLAGGAFSLYLGVAARRRTLAELKPVRLGLTGGLIAGLLVPGYILWNTLGIVYISGIAPVLVGAGATSAVLGGLTAYGTLKLAQRGALEPGADSAWALDAGGGWE